MDELALGFFPDLANLIVDVDELIGLDTEYAPHQTGYDENERFSNKCLTHSEIRWNSMRREYAQTPAAPARWPSVGWVKRAEEAAKRARQNASKVEIPVLLL